MDIRNLQDKLRDLNDKLPTERGDRIKAIAVAVVLPLLLIWVIWYVATSMLPPPAAEALDTPAWKTALELEQSLKQDPTFRDLGFSVATEKPLRFIVRGGVHADRDLAALEKRLKELRPEGDYDLEVEVIKPQPQ